MTEASDPETGFLEQLGQRVRTMRALRGMSRKVLAKVSGISERYIAQLESGKGNVSIVLLRRVSNAMGAHLEDLIPSDRAGAGLGGHPRSPAQGDARPDRAGQGRARRRRHVGAAADLVLRHRPDRPARRRQIHARQDAGEENRLEFVELNKEVEAQNGLSVAEIIALYGQEGFRRMEQAALRNYWRARN